MSYQPVDGVVRAVEVMTFGRLRTLNDGGTQRADFHVLAVIEAGHGSVSIDFASYPLTARSAVWIAPGAVHRWDEMADVAGHLVLFIPTAPVTQATRELVAAAMVYLAGTAAAVKILDGRRRGLAVMAFLLTATVLPFAWQHLLIPVAVALAALTVHATCRTRTRT